MKYEKRTEYSLKTQVQTFLIRKTTKVMVVFLKWDQLDVSEIPLWRHQAEFLRLLLRQRTAHGTQIIIFWLALSRFFCFLSKSKTRDKLSNLGKTNHSLVKNIYKISRLQQLKMITNNNISSKYFSTQFICDNFIFKHTSRKRSVTNIDVREMT